MARVFVTRQLPGSALARLTAAHDVSIWPKRLPPPPDALRKRAAEAEGLLTLLTDRVDHELLAAAPHLRAIANYAVGVDNIDLEAVARRGIQVGNTPDVLTDATADLTFTLILALARNLLPAAHDAHRGKWLTWEPGGYLGHSVHGATLGIVGFGRIGQAVAKRARGFEMRVLNTNEHTLSQVLRESDLVSLHVPLTPSTRHLIDDEALKQMRPGAMLINTARGGVVDQPALIRALHDGTIAGAALDVTDPEPPPPNDPILATPNLLLVPHIGSATHAARERMAEMAVENLLAALDGKPMPYPATHPSRPG